ncbi:peptide ABC transporter permease [Floricoccus penangensis]|uniref:Peptide ABC transporter permease n=1 Tax=Floricoccus penangensis TaxID=1859475 RepID=A0A9Q5P0B1_9LACT|nr:ABC transporter permease [Floricoccus penangensis]OFI47577.1 peptide ABC transporter permease [Floricoccus penangensis]
MKKYILTRLLRAIFSIIVVTTIVYALIFTLIPRRQIFTSDPNISKVAGDPDKKLNYENTVYRRQGYIDYYNSKQLSNEISKTDKSFSPEGTKKNLEAAQEWAKDKGHGWKVDQFQNNKEIFATREIPIYERVLNFYKNLIQFDHPWKIHDKSNPNLKRYIKFEWNKGMGPAIVGSGTQHKYLFYFDGAFPFIHQNFIKLYLGDSYPTFSGREVMDVLTSGQGQTKSQEITLDDGNKMMTSYNLHTAEYQSPENQDERAKRMFKDDYTDVKSNYQDPSMIKNSFMIGAIAVILGYLIAIPIATHLSQRAGRWIDRFGLFATTALIALPSLATIYFYRFLGSSLLGLPDSFTTYGAGDIKSYILPTVILALLQIPNNILWIRRFMLDQASSDYVKFARAKGLNEREIYSKHILKNAMIPLSNAIPTAVILAISGATMTETIFLLPGMGKMLPDAIKSHNNSMVIGLTFIFTTLAVVANLLGDLLMQKIDPRINLSGKGGRK